MMMEVSKREEEARIVPDPDVDSYMKMYEMLMTMVVLIGNFCERTKTNLPTDHILKVLGLDICDNTIVGDDMRRDISGGPKKRLTTGKVLYQAPRNQVVELFNGFMYPRRKGLADFLLEVISRKDQAQYWYCTEDLDHYVSVDMLCQNSRNLLSARSLMRISQCGMINSKATRIDIDVLHATYSMGALFFGLLILLVDGIPELSLTTARVPVLFKQKELCFYPAWAYAIPTIILKIPLHLPAWVVEVGFLRFLSFIWRDRPFSEYKSAPGSSCAMISQENLAKIQESQDSNGGKLVKEKSKNSPTKGRTFQDVKYYVDISGEKKKLHLLSDVTGALRPGVLTALMGVSGAGKSTLLDVLAGRKTTGYIRGEIKIGAYPKKNL
ncbi:hypothetical protein Pint_21499 [Pistacia integerrima]|uniref:Uncharacterized protein n=1 Tax=Pistacia integerrima TaxID=434235 RepID=A0ACC0XA20_9ROSI|nr:hypothetical protein Pint_21499 [Pistacia integerrima]